MIVLIALPIAFQLMPWDSADGTGFPPVLGGVCVVFSD